MFCKRLKATMKVSTCHKRQEKAHRDLGYEVCRTCPQMAAVNAGKETDRDINRIIRELSKHRPPVTSTGGLPMSERPLGILFRTKKRAGLSGKERDEWYLKGDPPRGGGRKGNGWGSLALLIYLALAASNSSGIYSGPRQRRPGRSIRSGHSSGIPVPRFGGRLY